MNQETKTNLLTSGKINFKKNISSGGSKGGAGEARPPPGVQILLISCSFWEKIRQIRMLAPPWGVGTPSSGKSWIRY